MARGSGGTPSEPSARKPKVHVWVAFLALLAAGAALALYDRSAASASAALSRTHAQERIHIEKVTSLRRDARKTHVALLEGWLATPADRGTNAGALRTMVDRVEAMCGDFARLEPIGADELASRDELAGAVSGWATRLRSALAVDEGPAALEDMKRALAAIDRHADRILEINSRGGALGDLRTAELHRLRSQLQLGLAATIAGVLLLAAWWRSQVQAEARHAQRVRAEQERVARMRSLFFANMSHELRTPLVAIGGHATLIRETPKLDGRTREAVERIERDAADLLGVINNILDVAKLESDHVQLLVEDVWLPVLLDRCVQRCAGLVGKKSVVVMTDVAPNLPPVRGDFVKLQQVFTNLIANAVKFTEEGGVVVRARREDASHLAVEVEDTGVGIEAEALEKIWEPFHQADGTIARKFGGTGLGLAIVRGVVDLLGGSVSVRSRLGHGTTFTVRLPCATASGPAPRARG